MRTGLLSKAELLQLISLISHPSEHNLTQEQLEQALTDFCAGCPDPLEAYRLVVEYDETLSDEEVIDRASKMSLCQWNDVPTSIVPTAHPARARG